MGVFNGQVSAGNDDGYGLLDGTGSWFNTSGVQPMGKGSASLSSFFRFQSVSIAPGVTITAAKLTLYFSGGSANNITTKIYGLAEDNASDFASDPRSRTRTTAFANWSFTEPGGINYEFDTADFTSVIQEIVNRGGWSSGNSLAIRIDDNGSTAEKDCDSYEHSTVHAAKLVITYSGSSPSASTSPSSSISSSPSPSFPTGFAVLDIAKDGINVLNNRNPKNLKFSSRYGTLKYYSKVSTSIQIVGTGVGGDFAGTTSYSHNLGYYPYAEVFVRVYIGSPSGNYEYVPFAGAGASILYSANYKITTSAIVLYAEFSGVSSSTWNFDFIIFIYKNDLQL